jgi:hypothetical protein
MDFLLDTKGLGSLDSTLFRLDGSTDSLCELKAGELRSIFPTKENSVLLAHSTAAKGDFNSAFKLAMGEPEEASMDSIFAHFPKESQSQLTVTDFQDHSAALLAELRGKFGTKLESARLALGDGYDDLQILLCFEKHVGDARAAISDLMGQSTKSIERSQMSISRDSIRRSASLLLRSGKSSSGIEQLPVNLDLSIFGSDDEEDEENGIRASGQLPPLMRPEDLELESTGSDTSIEETASTESTSVGQNITSKSSTGATSASTAITKGLDALHTVLFEEFQDMRKKQLGELKPWPTAAPISTATAAPSIPIVPRIIDKSDLSKGDNIDSDALKEFLSNIGGNSAEKSAAYTNARKISTDDFVVIGHTLRSLRQFFVARKDAMTSKPTESTSKRTKTNVSTQSAPTLATTSTNSETPELPITNEATEDTRRSPISTLDITSFVQDQLSAGVDLASLVEQCNEMQMNEITELESILTADRIQVSDSTPRIVSIALSEPEYVFKRVISEESLVGGVHNTAELSTKATFKNPLLLQLLIVLPSLYPEVPPIISIRSNCRSTPLSQSDYERLEAAVAVESLANQSMPCLFALQQAAEAFLSEDPSIKAKAIQEYALTLQSASGNHVAFDPNLFDSLKLIFNFKTDYNFHRFEDILNQRTKAVNRAIQLLINGPKAAGLDPPIIASFASSNSEYPIHNLTGDVDFNATLRLIGLSASSVRVLLQAFDWKLRHLSTAFLSAVAGNTYEAFLKQHGVHIQQHEPSGSSAPSALPIEEEVECPTCFCDVPRHQTFSLSCGHVQCASCYCEYVDVNISGGGAQAITCPAPGCKFILDQVSLMSLLSAKRWSTYSSVVVSHFVTTNKMLSWCSSSAGCDYIIQDEELNDGPTTALPASSDSAPSSGSGAHNSNSSSTNLEASSTDESTVAAPTKAATLIRCKCTHTYCNLCGKTGGHFPATCDEITEWERLHPDDMKPNEDDEATLKMLKTITRTCPKCALRISKSGGCPHMVCRMCSHEFCWVCFSDWNSSHYRCEQGDLAVSEEAGFLKTRVDGFDSLLVKHRNACYDVTVTLLKDKLMKAFYRPDWAGDSGAKGGINATSSSLASKDLSSLITFSDIECFITSLEVLHLAHYLVTNTCKAAVSMSKAGLQTAIKSVRLWSTISRVVQDMQFLAEIYKTPVFRKEITFHLNAAIKALRVSIKLLLSHMNSIRMHHLAETMQ